MRSLFQNRRGKVWVIAASVVAVVGVSVAAAALYCYRADQAVRAEMRAAIDQLRGNALDIEGKAEGTKGHRPGPEEIQKLIGREPDLPLDDTADRTAVNYTWNSPLKTYTLQLVYIRNKQGKLELKNGAILGSPF